MSFDSKFRLSITRRGPPPRPFGWELFRRDDAHEVERSTDTFRSRHEAITDGERVQTAWDSGVKA